MVCKYSGHTWFIILGMIFTGAARSIVVKLALYQSGLRAPLTVTLLYLLGQALSLVVHGIKKSLTGEYRALSVAGDGDDASEAKGREKSIELGPPSARRSIELGPYASVAGDDDDVQDEEASPPIKDIETTEHTVRSLSDFSEASASSSPASPSSVAEFCASLRTSFHGDGDEMPSGSSHGLSVRSEESVRWAHRVPYYVKPAVPAVLNLLNSAFRWASLVYIDASVAEMMISGLELTLSVVAARVLRKRMVAWSRWVGVVIVAVGVIIIERANNSRHRTADEEEDDDSHHGAQGATLGVVLIVFQSVLSVLQDIGEEIFMQAANFPAGMMLGLEGLYGLCVGVIVYVAVGDRLGVEDIDNTISTLRTNAELRLRILGLPLLFLITGIFNIKATEATSAMTRNVWKNMRTVLVWVVALGIFYLGNDPAYGEQWHTPESFVILFGFLVMCMGIIAYYWFKEQEQNEAAQDGDAKLPKR